MLRSTTDRTAKIALGVTALAVMSILVVSAISAEHTVRAAASDAAAVSPDATCARCHAAIAASYARTPMARASGAARDGLLTGDFVHAASGIRYRVQSRDAEPTLHYERVRSETGPALNGEVRLRYFIGSNTRGRTFLFSNEGRWFETPINWYSKRSLWDMAPAYENARSMPFTMPVDANCLHCHATGVAPAEGARNHFAGAPFAQGGVGCSACHADSRAHVASGGRQPTLNPAKLSPLRRDSVCLQCHLEGDAVVYRAGRSLSDFVAGDDLSNDAVYFVDGASAKSQGRASSQYEALLRSACKRASGDRLTCTTCHDSHSSPSPVERVAVFRAKCLQCHTGEAMATAHHPEQQDCASCHMPTRKTTDISHEQLTDHDIESRPSGDGKAPPGLALMSPLAPASGALLPTSPHTAELVAVGGWQAGARERGLAYAQFATRNDSSAKARALSLLRRAEFDHAADAVVHANLGFLLQSAGQMAGAKAEYLLALAADPHDSMAATNLAILDAGEGKAEDAKRRLREVAAFDPSQTAAMLDLALLECQTGEKPAARAVVEQALAFNPDSAEARRFLDQGRVGPAACSLH